MFQECIEEARQAGRTVLLSSHTLCDRVSIIRAGRTVETGSLVDLRHLTRTAIDVETVQEPSGLAALEGVHDLQVDDQRARFDVDTAQLDKALRHLSGLGVRTLTSQPPTLEELFLRHYGDEIERPASPRFCSSRCGAIACGSRCTSSSSLR